MSRTIRSLSVVTFVALAVPAPAYAAEALPAAVDSLIRFGISLVGLLIAVLLLLEAIRLGKVAAGGAIAEKLNYVVLATLCLAASALAQWVVNFVPQVSADQVQLASEVLVIVAMALLAVYFAGVRHALVGYMESLTGSQLLAEEGESDKPQAQASDGEEAAGRG